MLLAAWHIFASFLWIAPPSPLRQVVPGDALRSYMIPFFGQSWSVFAPEPINGDYHFNVRAVIVKDGQKVTTGWVSATDVELSMLRDNLFPPRAGIQSSEVASRYKSAFDALTPAERSLVGGSFTADRWETGLQAGLTKLPKGSEAGVVTAYMKEEHLSAAYATQVAHAIWGKDVTQVQFRVSRQNVVPFAQRNDTNAQRPAPTVILPGWRAPISEPGQSTKDFTDVFHAQFERMAK
ncbi:DUF5819 family protein [Leucobacter sp. HNU]|uniref:DUF5819 family protein n=1 Tax=Leucobacter sp. HNU TaxID=3236805 RepID=UPI003A81149B